MMVVAVILSALWLVLGAYYSLQQKSLHSTVCWCCSSVWAAASLVISQLS